MPSFYTPTGERGNGYHMALGNCQTCGELCEARSLQCRRCRQESPIKVELTQKTLTILCLGPCAQEFTHLYGGTGRWPTYCPKCREAVENVRNRSPRKRHRTGEFECLACHKIIACSIHSSRKFCLQCSKIADALREESKRQAPKHKVHTTARRYGVTSEWYESKFNEQNGVCKICEKPTTLNRALCIDHNHKTGTVRDLLCHKCNLGKFEEDPILLRRAADYFERWASEEHVA